MIIRDILASELINGIINCGAIIFILYYMCSKSVTLTGITFALFLIDVVITIFTKPKILEFNKYLISDEYYDSTLSLLWGSKSEVRFVVEGQSFRVLVGTVPEKDSVTTNEYERFKAQLYVDGEYITTKNHTSSKLNFPRGNRIEFDYEFEEEGRHEVKLLLTSSKDEVHIDAIDVRGKLVEQDMVTDENENIQKPLYKYYYTVDKNILDNDTARFIYKGIKCYVKADKVQSIVVRKKPVLQEAVSLYRYCRKGDDDHFYTTNYNEIGDGNGAYELESIQCYVIPFN